MILSPVAAEGVRLAAHSLYKRWWIAWLWPLAVVAACAFRIALPSVRHSA